MTIWTAEQEAIFEAATTSKTNLFIQAYAGCAKTTTLAELSRRIKGTSALAMSFGVKTTKELRNVLPEWIDVKTANSIGMKAWYGTIGKRMEVAEDKLHNLMKGYGLDEDDWHTVREMVRKARHVGLVPVGSQAVHLVEDTEENWRDLTNFDPDLELIRISREILKKCISLSYQGTIDFDDQIYMSALFGGVFNRYNLVLVDEAQDLSKLNIRQLNRCAAGRIIAFGDEYQSIYAFRGASSSAMQDIRALRPEWIDLTLSESFRCPKAIVRRRNHFLPAFRACATNREGTIIEYKNYWKWSDIPKGGTIAVLSRNNAPLVAMSFRLMSLGIPFSVIGQENQRPLISLAKKILPDGGTTESYTQAVIDWKASEFTRIGDKPSRLAVIEDKAECLMKVISLARPTSLEEVKKAIRSAYSTPDGCAVTLSSVHRAKGLEFDTVVHLDPWRIPSMFAITDEDRKQEMNILNVVETRSKDFLILASINMFQGE